MVKRAPNADEIADAIVKKIPPPLIQSSGNLRQRTLDLANEIEKEMAYRMEIINGALKQNPPLTPQQARDLQHSGRWSISTNFRLRFLDRVRHIRDECAQFHVSNKQLDDFLRSESDLAKAKATIPDIYDKSLVDLSEIEQVEKELREMAQFLPDETKQPR